MQYKLHSILLSSALLTGLLQTTHAQTVANFENVTLPGSDTTYLQSQASNGDGIYTFNTGNVKLYGSIDFGGTYFANFNCSNHTDTVTPGPANQFSNIVGSGVDGSANYGIAFIESDWSMPGSPNIPVKAKLTDDAAGNIVAGCYITNSVYAYRYMLDDDYYAENEYWFKLIIKGYNAGVAGSDSVVFTLADFSNPATPVLVNTWQWVDLTSLGNVDSLTFNLESDDVGDFGMNTPAYFAIDNLITLDGNCPSVTNLAASDITENSATITWQNTAAINNVFNYEVAVDNTQDLAPTAAVSTTGQLSYDATGLEPNTTYYAHIRTKCASGSYADWDTVSFKTEGNTGIFNLSKNNLDFSIWPNPASEQIFIASEHALDVKVFDVNGKEVLSAVNTKIINIATLAQGVYFLKAYDAKTQKSGAIQFIKTSH